MHISATTLLIALAATVSASPFAIISNANSAISASQLAKRIAAPLLRTPTTPQLEPRATTVEHPYVTQIIDRHNAHRKNNTAAPVVWNHTVENDAKTLAQLCVFQHNTAIGAGDYGQNLAAGWAREDVGYAITNGWYNEYTQYVGEYNDPTPTNFESVGHFTQVVWLGTQSVGCFTWDCAAQGGLKDTSGNVMQGLDNFTVCNYFPPGNYIGSFNLNVKQSIGLPPYDGPETVTYAEDFA